MLILPKNIDQKEKEDNVVSLKKFKTVPGGKDPTDNWLKKMPDGKWFLCRPRGSNNIHLDEFCVIYHTPSGSCTYLGTRLKEITRFCVMTKEFSAHMEKVEELEEGIDG